jgi:glycosyltransferase involved in cell wall biosynthesis
MGMPIVTVVIPAFNAASYIGEALDSIRGQMSDMEVLLVDDGSRDNTIEKAQAFADAFELRILRQENSGPSAARNLAITQARGRYCALLDADDVMLPGRLAAQVKELEANPELGLVHTDLMTFDHSGIIHRSRRAFSNPCGGQILDRLLLDNFITTSTVMAPTTRLISAGLFNLKRRISHDFELWLAMAARWPVGYIDRPLIRYRCTPGSVSNNKVASAQDALEVIEAFWRENPQHRQREPDLYRQSLAEHLAGVGEAALMRGDRRKAVSHLVKSLRLTPSRGRSWKWLAKAAVRPGLAPARN